MFTGLLFIQVLQVSMIYIPFNPYRTFILFYLFIFIRTNNHFQFRMYFIILNPWLYTSIRVQPNGHEMGNTFSFGLLRDNNNY